MSLVLDAKKSKLRSPDARSSAELTVILDDAELRITMLQRSMSSCVVSFSGIGKRKSGEGEVQGEEFRASFELLGDTSIVFVIDKTRSWLNYVEDRVVNTLVPVLREYDRVITVGNSMGGFAAIYLASVLPNCSRAIGFAPQFSVNPQFVPDKENRWSKFIKNIDRHPIGHAFDRPDLGVDYWIIVGTNDDLDREHLAKFEANERRPTRLQIVRVEDAGHEVAVYLRATGALREVLERLVSPVTVAAAEIEALIEAKRSLPEAGVEARKNRKVDNWQARRALRKAARKEARLATNVLEAKEARSSVSPPMLPEPSASTPGMLLDGVAERRPPTATLSFSGTDVEVVEALKMLPSFVSQPFRFLLREMFLEIWALPAIEDHSERRLSMNKIAMIRGHLLDLEDAGQEGAQLWADRYAQAATAWKQARRRIYEAAIVAGIPKPDLPDTVSYHLDDQILCTGWYPERERT